MGGTVPDLAAIGTKASGGLLHTLRREVADLLERPNTHFPGAQPISFARAHLLDLQRRDYWVCEKSDGVRCLLYMTRDGDHEVIYLIDRKNDYYFVDGMHFLRLPDSVDLNRGYDKASVDWSAFHTETILDGELLYDVYKDRTELKFLVFDCLLVDGKSLMQRTLDKRLAYFNEKIYRPFRELKRLFPDDVAGLKFEIEQKSFQLSYGMAKMFNEILPRLPHGNDGLIFTCRETAYKTGTDDNILKWKPAEENSVDFRLRLEFPELAEADQDLDDPEGVWERDYDAVPRAALLVFHGDADYRPYGEMHLTPGDWAKMKQWAIDEDDGLDGQVVECNQDAEGRWRFMRFRTDKEHGNHVSVVAKVLESIQDSVEKDELMNAAPRIRTEWKKREAEEAKRREHEKVALQEAAQREALLRRQQQQPPPKAAPVDDGYED